MARVFILYDDRAADGFGTEDASVLVCCSSDQEARSYQGDFGGMACYSYEEKQVGDSIHLVNEQFEWNWFPKMPRRKRKAN